MDLGEIGWGGVDWIGTTKDKDKWRALAYAVMNLLVPLNAGKLSTQLADSQIVLSSIVPVSYILVFLVIFFFLAFPLITYVHSSPPPLVLQALTKSGSIILITLSE
jgi:hypothetical protein